MHTVPDYLEKNRHSWNERTSYHINSGFYDMEGFLKGQTSLKEIELYLLGDVTNKKILHLQCHFGQDSISLARMGAIVTGIDLSDNAINKANNLAAQAKVNATFICCDIYDLPDHLNGQFDIVFTSYGTIGWLPELDKWAKIISHFLKPGGKFIFVEFHPVVWMFDDNFDKVGYNYFNDGPIMETESGTYADKAAPITTETVCWNHSISEVVNSLLHNDISLDSLDEFNYSPYNCFKETVEFETGKYRIKHLENRIPMLYAIRGTKKS